MTARTAWTPGSVAATMTAAFLAADLNSLPNLSSVVSSVVFDNTFATLANLADQFLDASFVGAIAAASTIASGAGIGLWLAPLNNDGTTYGEGRAAPGAQTAQATWQPVQNPLPGFPVAAGATITAISGMVLNQTLPPQKLRLVLQNQTGFAFAAAGSMLWIQTYRQSVNA